VRSLCSQVLSKRVRSCFERLRHIFRRSNASLTSSTQAAARRRGRSVPSIGMRAANDRRMCSLPTSVAASPGSRNPVSQARSCNTWGGPGKRRCRSRRLRTLRYKEDPRTRGSGGMKETRGRAGLLPGAAWGAGENGRAAEIAVRVEPAKSARSWASARVSTLWFLGSPAGCSGRARAPRVNLLRERTAALLRDRNQRQPPASSRSHKGRAPSAGQTGWGAREHCVSGSVSILRRARVAPVHRCRLWGIRHERKLFFLLHQEAEVDDASCCCC
jgi:hypothetical protein